MSAGGHVLQIQSKPPSFDFVAGRAIPFKMEYVAISKIAFPAE